jgi:hypothetical protein
MSIFCNVRNFLMYLFLCVMTYRSSFVRICITISSDLRNFRGCIQRETFGMGPCAGADYNLTYLIDGSEVQLSIPVTNADDVSSITQKWNNQ